ncbi:MAG TPA: universal stress protein [Chitinophagales bacterium]|nr:universal stress protein [Chitinophagales bacterium]
MKTILVPTDFSLHARNAMKYSVKIAESLRAELIFFHCTNAPVSRKILGVTEREMKKVVSDDVAKKMQLLDREIKEVYELLNHNRELTEKKAVVKSGFLIVEEILDVAKKNKVDLIVTGTHGATGTEKLFGSNTSNLISKSPIPVLAIPKRYRYKTIRKIIYASDLASTLLELKEIIPLAQTFEATIDIFNLYYEEVAEPENFFKNLITQVNYPNLRLIQLKRNLDKTILRQLREYLDRHKPDLLVMFPAERDVLEKIFNESKTEKLSYNLKMPLLSIKKR